MLLSHEDDMVEFLTNSKEGNLLPNFLKAVTEHLVQEQDEAQAPGARQLALFSGQDEAVVEELRRADPDSLTPIQALALLAELKKRLSR